MSIIGTRGAQTAQDLADAVMSHAFSGTGHCCRFSYELSHLSSEEQDKFIDMSVTDRLLRLKTNEAIDDNYDDYVDDALDVFVARREAAIQKHMGELRRDPATHIMACDPQTWLGRAHSEDEFCQDPDQYAYYQESVTGIAEGILKVLPQDIRNRFALSQAEMPLEQIELIVIHDNWNVDFLENISYNVMNNNRLRIRLDFLDDLTGEKQTSFLTI